MQHAVYLPPHGALADPRLLVELAVVAEGSGWDGVFLWDHVLRPEGRPPGVADAGVCLAGIAAATTRIRLGPMVTPLARRRPQKVARETVALDLLSDGRLTFGIGLGVNTGGELERFGEEVEERRRGERLDEALELLLSLWRGDVVHHEGEHFAARDVTFLPRAVQHPRIPIWSAARGPGTQRTIRRAASLDGVFPVHTSKSELERMVSAIEQRRGSLAGFDVAWIPDGAADADDLAALGVTWRLLGIPEEAEVDQVMAAIARGPQL